MKEVVLITLIFGIYLNPQAGAARSPTVTITEKAQTLREKQDGGKVVIKAYPGQLVFFEDGQTKGIVVDKHEFYRKVKGQRTWRNFWRGSAAIGGGVSLGAGMVGSQNVEYVNYGSTTSRTPIFLLGIMGGVLWATINWGIGDMGELNGFIDILFALEAAERGRNQEITVPDLIAIKRTLHNRFYDPISPVLFDDSGATILFKPNAAEPTVPESPKDSAPPAYPFPGNTEAFLEIQ